MPAKVYIVFIIAAACSATWALAIRPIQLEFERKIRAEASGLLASLIRPYDIQVSYENISPALLGHVKVRGLTVSSRGNLLAAIPSLDIGYDLPELLRTRKISSLRSVTASGLDLTLDLARDKYLLDLLSGSSTVSSPATPIRGLKIVIKKSAASVRLPDGTVVGFRGNSIKAVVEDSRISLDAKAELTLALTVPILGIHALKLPFQASGYVLQDFSLAEADLKFSAITDEFTVKAKTWSVKADANSVTAKLPGKSGTPDIYVAWDPKLARVQASVSMDRFEPSSFVALSDRYKNIEPWLSGRYGGRLEVTSDLTPAGTDFSASLETILPIDAPGGRPSASIALSGSPDRIAVRRIRLKNSLFDLGLSGTAYPGKLGFEGSLAVDYALSESARIKTVMEVFASEGSLFAYARETLVAGSVVRDLSASMNFKAEELFFLVDAVVPSEPPKAQAAGVVAGEDSYVEPEGTKLSLEGSVWLGKDPYLSASVSFESLAFAGFPGMLGSFFDPSIAGILKNIVLAGSLNVYSDFKEYSYNVSNAVVTYAASRNAFAVLTVQGNRQKLEISKIDAHIAGYSIGGSAAMLFEPNGANSVQVDVTVDEVPYKLTASLMQDDIFISGDYGLRVILNTRASVVSGSIFAENLPIPAGGSVFFVSMSAALKYVSFDNWKLALESMSIVPSGSDPAGISRVDLAGELNHAGATLDSLRVQGRNSSLQGNMNVTWSLSGGLRVALDSVLNGSNGEAYAASGEYSGGFVSGTFSARKALLERWDINFLQGIANVDAEFSGSLSNPLVTASFVLNEGREMPNAPFLEGNGSYENGLVKLDSLMAYTEGLSVKDGSLDYDVARGRLSGSGVVNYAFQTLSNVSNISGKFRVEGSAPTALPLKSDAGNDIGSVFSANPIGSFLEYDFKGSVSLFTVREKTYPDWPFDLRLGKGSLNLVCGADRQFALTTAPSGDFSAHVASSLPVSGDLAGRLKNGVISIKTENVRADLPFLFTFLEFPIVKAQSGVARGNIQITGPVKDPVMSGSIEFQDFFMKLEDFVSDAIGPITSPIIIDGKEADLSQATVACGDSTVSLQLFLSLSAWLPDSVRVNIKGSEGSLVHLKSKILGLIIDGYSNPDISITVDERGPNVSGTLAFPKGDIEITSETLASGRGEFVRPSGGALSADMQILFGKNVTVKFQPNISKLKFPIFSGQTDPSSRLRILYNGNTGDFSIKGKTVLRGGSVFYIQKNFFLKTATVDFDEDSSSFNPLVTLKAETRTANAAGPVLVTVSAINVPLNMLTFRLESIPSYSESEIASLLGQDLVATNKGSNFDAGKALIENSDIVPQLDIVSLFKTRAQSLLGLDFLYMKTLVVQRWLYDLSGLGTSGETMTLADYLDNSAIVAGKYFTDDLFGQATFRMQESPLAQSGNLRLDLELSLEWNAPHFLLNWQIRPDLYNYFLPEQSLSVSWRIALP